MPVRPRLWALNIVLAIIFTSPSGLVFLYKVIVRISKMRLRDWSAACVRCQSSYLVSADADCGCGFPGADRMGCGWGNLFDIQNGVERHILHPTLFDVTFH